MAHLEFIKPVELSGSQKDELQRIMSKVNDLLRPVAEKRGLKRLRDQVRANPSPEVKALMDSESLILAGYIRIATKLVNAFQRSSSLEEDDLWQEATIAIYDAMYSYNGQTEFSTYAYNCIKNRLIKLRMQNQKKVKTTGLFNEDGQLIDVIDPSSAIVPEVDLHALVNKAKLSPKERVVIHSSMRGKGWQINLAEEWGRTKQLVSEVYRRALNKMKVVA